MTSADCIGPGIELVPIAPGRFAMGSNRGFELEKPVHEVLITRPFLIGRTPITQAQWDAVMGSNPSILRGERTLPVENISWDDCRRYCAELSRLTGRLVSLPSEAEWEYACRAGSETDFFFGDDPADLPVYAWFDLNSASSTHPVGLKQPNTWGLHDMAGNVWEWCQDVWHSDYEGAPSDARPWMDDEQTQPRRCLRGGAWIYDAMRCRSAYRSREWKHMATDHFGLRIVVEC